ncbi:hypothetical protein ACPPVU_12840 [Mucilaginibacter sp. McL0603]|uniref:hypothetical protein n=1 Tax=Mucilaginibacter sp. McL0603 TaxID=3415670 RepID=UPI003CF5249D
MKRFLLIFSLTGLVFMQAGAQFLGGFFSQQSHKEQLMMVQIAAWQLYLSDLKSGYHIAETGLNTAHEMKNGTFSLHTAYFNSLDQVNPAIQNNPKAKAIATMGQQIVSNFDQEIAFQQKQQVLSLAEQIYLKQVYQSLLQKCRVDILELNDVLTPGKLQLTDQQRLERLDHIYANMQDKLAFSGAFTAKCHKLTLSRQQSAKDKQTLKTLYGGN